MLKGCSRLRRLYRPCASGVHPLYTTRRADTPPDPEALTRAVPATTTAPHSNRKQRIPPGKSPGVEVALAVGCGPQQALGADPPGLPPTGAARRLAKAPDVLRGQTPSEPQTHPAALVIDHGQVAGGMGAKPDRAEELTATETIFPSTDLRRVLTLNGPS